MTPTRKVTRSQTPGRTRKTAGAMTPYRATQVIHGAFNEFAAMLAYDAQVAENSLARGQGVGKPLRWDAWAWKKGNYDWWRRHDKACRALYAAETALYVLARLPYALPLRAQRAARPGKGRLAE